VGIRLGSVEKDFPALSQVLSARLGQELRAEEWREESGEWRAAFSLSSVGLNLALSHGSMALWVFSSLALCSARLRVKWPVDWDGSFPGCLDQVGQFLVFSF